MLFRTCFSFIPFFNGNECGEGVDKYSGFPYYGSDIYVLTSPLSANPPFLSCYTTTHGKENKRCFLREGSSGYIYSNKSDWVINAPSPFSLLINEEEGEDSYGCGIDEEFPCKSEEGLCNHPSSLLFLSSSGPYLSKEIFIKSEDDGEGGSHCGIKENPCLSLNEGKNHLNKGENELFLVLLESLSISSSYSNILPLTIQSYEEEETDQNNNNNNERRTKKKNNNENPCFALSLVNGEDSSIFHNSLSLSFFSLSLILNFENNPLFSSIFFF
jgi:hypothetical protein